MTFIEHFIGLSAFDQIRLLMLSAVTLESIFPRNLQDFGPDLMTLFLMFERLMLPPL